MPRLLLPVIMLAMRLSGADAGVTRLHLSPAGNDAWSGRTATMQPGQPDGPLATPERARDQVRKLIAAGLRQPIEVVLHEGIYELPRTLTFGPQDGGTREFPIAWRAAEGARVLLRGTRKVTGWRPWKGKILQSDLKAQGLGGLSFHQLFQAANVTPADGFTRRLTLARFPNIDPQHPRTGGFLYMAGTRSTSATSPSHRAGL